MVRVIIAGSRTFDDYKFCEKKCNEVFSKLHNDGVLTGIVEKDIRNIEIISGTAKGADKLGELFAANYNIPAKQFPAEWDKYGKSAGHIRNEQMAKYATSDGAMGVLIAFWRDMSKGTQNMINLANRYGLKVFIY